MVLRNILGDDLSKSFTVRLSFHSVVTEQTGVQECDGTSLGTIQFNLFHLVPDVGLNVSSTLRVQSHYDHKS